MAGEAKNLLTRTLATAADDSMQLYVVYNGRDYRILLSTLLSLVSKARLGLENVDNTNDMDKPISTATQAALSTKADSSNVVTREEWNLFVQQFAGMMSPAELEAVISEIQTALLSKVTAGEMQTAITTALEPVVAAISEIQNNIAALQQASANFVTGSTLNNAIAAVTAEITALQSAFSAYVTSNDERVLALENRVTTLEENQLVFGPNYW